MIHENADTIVGRVEDFFEKRCDKKRRLKKYKHQFWGEISPNDDYILCITFQCGYFDSLAIERCEITTVLDGSTCFFELDIDMKRNKIKK